MRSYRERFVTPTLIYTLVYDNLLQVITWRPCQCRRPKKHTDDFETPQPRGAGRRKICPRPAVSMYHRRLSYRTSCSCHPHYPPFPWQAIATTETAAHMLSSTHRHSPPCLLCVATCLPVILPQSVALGITKTEESFEKSFQNGLRSKTT